MSTFKSIATSFYEAGVELYESLDNFSTWFTQQNEDAVAQGQTRIVIFNRDIAKRLDLLNDSVHTNFKRTTSLHTKSDKLASKLGLPYPTRVALTNTKQGVHVVF